MAEPTSELPEMGQPEVSPKRRNAEKWRVRAKRSELRVFELENAIRAYIVAYRGTDTHYSVDEELEAFAKIVDLVKFDG